ncbi:hypothetical protein D3C80_1537780 [compost metagenome]
MIDDCTIQIDRSIIIHQVLMQRIPSGVHLSGEDDHIAHPQAANFFLADRCSQANLA